MTNLTTIDLAQVTGGVSRNYDPDLCTMAVSSGALVGGAVGTGVGALGGVPNIGFFAGAAVGGGLAHHFSPNCK